MDHRTVKRVTLCINGLVLGLLMGAMIALWMDGISEGRIYLAKVVVGTKSIGF